MPKTTFTATCPDGSIVTRTSKTRTYTHCVVARHSKAGDERRARTAYDAYRSIYRFYVSPQTLLTYPEMKGSERVEEALGAGSVEAYVALKIAQQVATFEARVAAGYYDTFGAVGWQGRPDLAAKFAASCSREHYDDVTIVPVNPPKGA